jgi:hypothetical protein
VLWVEADIFTLPDGFESHTYTSFDLVYDVQCFQVVREVEERAYANVSLLLFEQTFVVMRVTGIVSLA